MAQNNFNVNDELLKLVQQQAQPQRQAVLNTGLLSGNQQNFGDVLANPDQAQVNAGIAGVAALLSGRDAGTALVNSASAFGNTRQQTYNNQLAANKVERETLKDRLASVVSVGNFTLEQNKFGLEKNKFSLSEDKFDLEKDKFNFDKIKRNSVDLFDDNGKRVGGAVQGPAGRLFKFNEDGSVKDVSAEIEKNGYSVRKAGTTDTSTTGSGSISTSLKKYNELIAQGVTPKAAQDIAFNITQLAVDPTTGNQVLFDPRTDGQTILNKGNVKDEKLNKQVTDLSTALEKADILEMGGIFDLVDKQILQTTGDLAGLGQTAFLHPRLLSGDGLKNRQLVAQLQNVVLKNRSGAAVTVPEFDRLKLELGTGIISGDREIRNALKRMKELFDDHNKSLRAGFSNEANDEYDRRLKLPVGGSNSVRLKYNVETGEFE